MGDLLLGLLQLDTNLVQQRTHSLLSVQHMPSFLITFDVVLYLLLEVFVDSLVFQNAQKAFVNLIVKHLVLVCKVKMFFSKIFTLDGRLVKLALADSHRVIEILELSSQVLVLVGAVIKSVT